MFGSFGWMELLLILFIVLIIFGAGKLPQLGEGVGKAIKGFKKSIHEPDPSDATEQSPAHAQLSQDGEPMAQGEPGHQPASSPTTSPEHNISQSAEPIHKS